MLPSEAACAAKAFGIMSDHAELRLLDADEDFISLDDSDYDCLNHISEAAIEAMGSEMDKL